jgi:hypothetical protein
MDDRDRYVRGRDMIVAFLARVLATHVLTDEQISRLIIELFADFLAELDADCVTAQVDAFRLGQRVFLAHAQQVVGQFLAASAVAFLDAAVAWSFFAR